MHDVTVSVWNRFHSVPLIEGLHSAGFDVLALGSTRRKPTCSEARTCWTAGLLTQACYRLPPFRDRLVEFALDFYQRFAARHALKSRCLWGWSNGHLAAFEKARAAGIPVILETGSTHVSWRRSVLATESAKHGQELDHSLTDRMIPRILAEYEIADRICVPNSFVARTFEDHGIPAQKLAINPYGVDFDFWSAGERRTTPNRKFTVVFAGQFMLRKGVSYLLEAWRRGPLRDAELWIVGPILDDARHQLRPLPENVQLLGNKTHGELRELYQQCDVYILPSLEEGMARAALEAMAAGLPVIVTEETGMGDVIVHGREGWVVPSKDAAALIEALQEAASDLTETMHKGALGRERASAYTWNAYGARAAQFLRRIINPAHLAVPAS